MKTKISLFLVVLFLLPAVCFGGQLWIKPDGNPISSPNVDSSGNQVIRGSVTINSVEGSVAIQPVVTGRQNPLVNGTTAAFSIYLTSANTSGVVTGTSLFFPSTGYLQIVCGATGGATTNYFDLSKSTSDTVGELINIINALGNGWTATASLSCYLGNQTYCTIPSTIVTANEGNNVGLQCLGATNGAGKSVSFSTGSANAVTIYFNGTQYISKYFEPVASKQYEVYDINTSLASGTTMYLYEGVKSTDTTTLIAIPHTDINEREYPIFAPLISSVNMALEYRVKFSTWVNTTNDRIQIFINNR